ncbi:unnamed protein product [Prorocentrum cordatum]|uniref:Cyclic nucleotide-binding domain-containing protein n=1 Tax=Prorocentrum cordatum TaxID=2364126 RepID=A0ABN9VKS8_9DINO|nr:unnamed protein product [Polarella glacialis]
MRAKLRKAGKSGWAISAASQGSQLVADSKRFEAKCSSMIAGKLTAIIPGKLEENGIQFEMCQVHCTTMGFFIIRCDVLEVDLIRTVTVTVADDCVLLVLERAGFEAAIAAAGGESRLPILEDAREMQNLMADRDAFGQISCFRNLDHDFVMTLFETLEPRVVYPGMVLMKEGNYGNEMYILHIGEVKVERGGQHLADCHSGTVLGELAVLGLDKRRTATVTAKKLCLVYVLHGDVFHVALQKFPESRRIFDRAYITKLLRHELQKAEEEKADLDKFYGSVHPMSTADFQAYLQNPGATEAARLQLENAVAVENA